MVIVYITYNCYYVLFECWLDYNRDQEIQEIITRNITTYQGFYRSGERYLTIFQLSI